MMLLHAESLAARGRPSHARPLQCSFCRVAWPARFQRSLSLRTCIVSMVAGTFLDSCLHLLSQVAMASAHHLPQLLHMHY